MLRRSRETQMHHRKKLKIAFYPMGGPAVASSRLRVYDVMSLLPRQFFQPELEGTGDVIVVQKRTDLRDKMIQWVVEGKKVFWDVVDWIEFDVPEGVQVTVGSEYLKNLYPGAKMLPDMMDTPRGVVPKSSHAEKLHQICWFGSPAHIDHTYVVQRACELLELQLVVITSLKHIERRPGIEYRQWDLSTIDEEIKSCDLVVCPYVFKGELDHHTLCKSENRLLKSWSLEMPVIGSPIPVYLEYKLRHLATTFEEWVGALHCMRCHQLRVDHAGRGRHIAQKVRPDLERKWIKHFKGLMQ